MSRAGCPTNCIDTSCLKIINVGLFEWKIHKPWHPRNLRTVVHVFERFVQGVEILNPRITVILPCMPIQHAIALSKTTKAYLAKSALGDRPYRQQVHVVGYPTCQGVMKFRSPNQRCVLPAEAKIKPTHERNGLINDTEFLVLL